MFVLFNLYIVKCLDTWAWYPAYVHDYDSKEKTLYVAYPDEFSTSLYLIFKKKKKKQEISLCFGFKKMIFSFFFDFFFMHFFVF